jgi:hypothetical protein
VPSSNERDTAFAIRNFKDVTPPVDNLVIAGLHKMIHRSYYPKQMLDQASAQTEVVKHDVVKMADDPQNQAADGRCDDRESRYQAKDQTNQLTTGTGRMR